MWDRLRALGGWRADLAAAGLGAAAALALPPFYLLPLLLVSVPGLLVLIEAAPGGRHIWSGAFRRGFAFGFAHHLVGLYWITNAILVMAAEFWWVVPLAVPLLSAVLAVFIAIPCALCRLAPTGGRRVMLLAGLWVLGDIARQFVLTGFPWNPWGSVWGFPGWLGTVMLQPAAWIGVLGLTLLTVLLAATPVLGRRAMAAGGLGLLFWAVAGLAHLQQPDLPPPGINVVIVQGDIPETEKQDRATALAAFARYLSLTRAALARAGASPLVVVWPETASPFLLDEDAAARAAIAAASVPARAALVGTVRFDAAGQPRNSLVAVMPDGSIGAIYDKAHLVPFGEYRPSYLPFDIMPQGFTPGPGPGTLHVAGLPPVGALICYEAIFPAQIVNETDRPDWLVNITNDAWFGDSTGPRQHMQAARLRAIEEGLPLVRAANTGISAVFDAEGRERAALPLGVAGTLTAALPGRRPPTAFARLGLTAPVVLALGCIGFGLGLGRRRSPEPPKPGDASKLRPRCKRSINR